MDSPIVNKTKVRMSLSVVFVLSALFGCKTAEVTDEEFHEYLYNEVQTDDGQIFEDGYVIWEDDLFLEYLRKVGLKEFAITVTHGGIVAVQVDEFRKREFVSRMDREQIEALRDGAETVVGVVPSGNHFGEDVRHSDSTVAIHAWGDDDELLFLVNYFNVREHEALQPFKQTLYGILQSLEWHEPFGATRGDF